MIDILSMYTLLPFVLILAVVYGGMESSGMFRSRGVKAAVSVVLAFFAVSSPQVVGMIHQFLPYLAILFVAFFGFGYAAKTLSGGEKDNTMIIVLLALFLLFVASMANAGNLYGYDSFLWLIGLAVVIGIFYAAYKAK